MTVIAKMTVTFLSHETAAAFLNLINARTDSSETGTVLALYTVALGGLVNMIAALVAGTIFDAIGPHWLYLLSAGGYLFGTKPEGKAD